jgi:DNA-directed RNA polymerase subunit M/transcription elongation factor TFIIS
MENGAMKAGRNDSENNQPHFEGKTCPECGRNKLHFRNFQKSGDKVVEVYNCSYCGPVVMIPGYPYGA